MKKKIKISSKNKEDIDKFKEKSIKKLLITIGFIRDVILLFIGFSSGFLCECLLFKLFKFILKSNISKYESFSRIFNYVELGTGLLTIFIYLLHVIYGAFSQFKFEKDISKND